MFSLQYEHECFCGNTLDNGASFDCYNHEATRCTGDKDQWCGGNHGISVYRGMEAFVDSLYLNGLTKMNICFCVRPGCPAVILSAIKKEFAEVRDEFQDLFLK